MFNLSGERVPTISAFLSAEEEWSPKPLKANAGKSFQGSIVLGLGFTMSEAEAQALIARDAKNAEALFPYLNGEDLNSHPEQKPSRWVINFWDWPLARDGEGSWQRADKRQRERWLREGQVPADYPARVAADFPELIAIVREKVKPERDRNNRKERREKWWHFAEKCPALYHAIGRGHAFARHPEGWSPHDRSPGRVIVQSQTSKYIALGVINEPTVFAHKIVVFHDRDLALFVLLQSSINDLWARKQSSTLETRLSYTPSDAFETLALPLADVSTLLPMGATYLSARAVALRHIGGGLTDLHNELNDPRSRSEPVAELREILQSLDLAVRDAYGWTDLDLGHGFHAVPYLPENDRIRFTISEPARLEVLRRLSRLNRERWQAEQDAAGATPGASAATTTQDASPRPRLQLVSPPGQPDLFN